MIDRFKDKNSLIEVLKNYLVNEKEDRPPEKSIGKFYPSSVGKCNRAILYQMLGYPQKNKDAKTYMILENGTYFHDRIEKSFKDSGVLVASELPLKNEELHVSGRLDLVIWNFRKDEEEPSKEIELKGFNGETVYKGSNTDVLIVELKSISDKGFNRLGNYPKDEHIDQLTLYMHETGIHDGIILYENKNTQELIEFNVRYNPIRAEKIIKKIKYCVEHFEKKKLPPKEYEKHDFQCQWCDFRENCWPSDHIYNIGDIL